MRSRDRDVTQQQLQDAYRYEPDSGLFVRLRATRGVKKVGPTGHKSRWGYIMISFAGRAFYAHRLAWLYVYGRWPDGDLDHIKRRQVRQLHIEPQGMLA